MFMAFMAVAVVASALLTGGSPGRLCALRLRGAWVVVVALAVQVAITSVVPDAPHPLDVALHLGTYAMAGLFVWWNRAVPGLVLLGAGAASNGVVIALNGGTLPASRSALIEAHQPVGVGAFANSGVLVHPVLPWLGDVAATPAWLPFRNVVSVGDVVILVGAAVLVHRVSGSRPARLAERGRSAQAAGPAGRP